MINHPWVVVAAATTVATLAGAAAHAQADVEAVERCRALPTDSERFSCLEAYVLEGEPPSAPAAPAAPPPVPAPPTPTNAAPTAAAADAPDEPERAGLLRRLRSPFTGGGAEERAPTVATDAAGAEALGAEQVSARRDERRPAATRYAFTIVDVGESFFGGLEIELSNGQVWRQQRDDGQRVVLRNEDPQTVEIWQSNRFGGYRMRLVEQGRTIRVERVR